MKNNRINQEQLHLPRHDPTGITGWDSDIQSIVSQAHVNQREIIPEMPGLATDRIS